MHVLLRIYQWGTDSRYEAQRDLEKVQSHLPVKYFFLSACLFVAGIISFPTSYVM